ncbi:MAG: polyketide cyclase [Candidatus Parabeggiatoa sp. nov. 2]|nr:MAG: polyketide cyclase [Beggiatoa sp. 4572_84]
MKILRRIIILLLILIAVALTASLFIDKDYSVQREVIINKPNAEVFDYLKYLKNQEEFSKWATMDPHTRRTYTGIDGQVGFISAWESDSANVGAGEQEIMKIIGSERIEIELRFLEPFESTELAYFVTEEISPEQTKVIWGFDGSMNRPMNLMLLFMDFEKMLGEDFEYGLGNAKRILESK